VWYLFEMSIDESCQTDMSFPVNGDKLVAFKKSTLKKNLYDRMVKQIRADLKENERHHRKRINFDSFIEANKENILEAVNDMYTTYEKDGELEDLEEPPNDWICEFLYDYVELPDNW
jgi:hypothetical protein